MMQFENPPPPALPPPGDSPRISIVLPVYNVRKFLPRALDGLLRQTFSRFEILGINDGSTDGSADLLHDCAARDPRLRIFDQPNSGAGAARNAGLAAARGECVLFLDADDIFHSRMLEKLWARYEETRADVVIFAFRRFHNRTRQEYGPPAGLSIQAVPQPQAVFSARDIAPKLFQITTPSACKLWRREFLREHGLSFQNLPTSNDLFFTYTGLAQARRIAILNESLFLYRTHTKGSLTHNRHRHTFCFFDALVATRDTLRQLELYELFETSFLNAALSVCLWNLAAVSGQAFDQLYAELRTRMFRDLDLVNLDPSRVYYPVAHAEAQEIQCLPLPRFKAAKLRKWICSVEKSKTATTFQLLGLAVQIPRGVSLRFTRFPRFDRFR